MKFNREAFTAGVNDIIRLRYIRWQIFRGLSHLGWWICPEPHRTILCAVYDKKWHEIKADIARHE